MKFDIDTYKEIIDTLTRNKSRSFLTGFGVFWGVFMLVGLMGGGKGLQEMLQNNFSGFATNSAIVFPQPTTKPYAGYQKGREWSLEYKDIERIKAQVPEIDVATPVLSQVGSSIVFKEKRTNCNVKGVLPTQKEIEAPTIYYGRFINEMDIQQHRKVCVLGKKIYKTLFPGGGNPCGQLVRLDSIYYQVVGIDYNPGNIHVNGSAEETVTLPITLMQQAYNLGDKISMIYLTGKPNVVISSITKPTREVVARAHSIDPTDEKGITVFNSEVMFGMVDNLFKGVNFLIWLVGIGTLLAGAVGVSNIMMVTVRERTTEIGIRRAIGATPRMILSQIITESVILIGIAGMSGILFAVGILQMAELANTTEGVVSSHFQVGFYTALGTVFLLTCLGVVAGLAPALRAMSIKPVDAMRDE